MPSQTDLVKHALAFPEAELHHPWGEDAAKVKGKVFAFLGRSVDGPAAKCPKANGLCVKLPVSAVQAIESGSAEEMGYGMAKHDWVCVKASRIDRLPLATAVRWMRESYIAVAPKSLAAQAMAMVDTRSKAAPAHVLSKKAVPKKAAVRGI